MSTKIHVLSSLAVFVLAGFAVASDITFFSYSDIHYGADNQGKSPPLTQCKKVDVINGLAGVAYPDSLGGVVDKPRGLIMQGDLINDGGVADKYQEEWSNYAADFGVNGEGRCKVPVLEGVGNHDLNRNMFVFNKVKERNVIRKNAGMISTISSNGYHYSWDWDGVHFVNVNLFAGNVWDGEADSYGLEHHPRYSRDFLEEDLRTKVGNSGRPVVLVQHFRPIDENWWTISAADKMHKVLQDYNVIAILVGHQGGGVNNTWRGINWISSNGELLVLGVKPDNTFFAVSRSAQTWGTPFKKNIYLSYADSGLPAVVNNGDWVSNVSASSATLSGKIVYQAVSPTKVTVYWGPVDGAATPNSWQNSKDIGVQVPGKVFTLNIDGLKPFETYYYRCQASNVKGSVWAAASIPFTTDGLLPSGWNTAFIGNEQRSYGGAHIKDGVITVKGSGRDIGEGGARSDDFQYAYGVMEGDGVVQGRIASMEVKTREPKVGIMLRESKDDNARHVSVLLTVPGGVRLMARKSTGGATSVSKGSPTKAPCWIRLVRKGSTFTGYMSPDGDTWTQVGEPLTLEMPARLLAGLAVTAGNRDGSRHHVSDFDQVTINGKAGQ